jgi:hypothetical protein
VPRTSSVGHRSFARGRAATASAAIGRRVGRNLCSVRVALDTNVWSYIAARGEIDRFEALEDARNLQVVIPPSTLMEAIRTPNPAVREEIIRAITNRGGSRVHLPTEARLEADELVAEAERLRPVWKRRLPNLASLRLHDVFWTRRVYQQARENPDSLATIEKALEVDEYLELLQRETQQEARESDFDITGAEPWARLDDPDVPAEQRAGWEGDRVMAWRVENAFLWWTQLTIVPRRRIVRGGQRYQFDTTLFDWVDPRLQIDAIRP